jgi:hypothetical protein
VGPVGLEGLVESAGPVGWAAMVHRLYLPAGTAAIGSTIRNIAGVPRTVTVQPQTGLAARHVAIPWRIARPVLGNSLAVRVGIWPAIVPAEAASAIAAREVVLGIVPAEVVPTASETEISRGAVAGIATRSAAAPVATTDRTHAPAATVVPLVWDLAEVEVEASVVEEAVGDGGNERKRLKQTGVKNEITNG